MKFPKFEIDDDLIRTLSQKYHIRELSLFGSVLREDFSDKSDIDILVEFSEDQEYSLFDLFEIRESFEIALGKKVDLIEKMSLRNPYRRKNILSTAQLIYAA